MKVIRERRARIGELGRDVENWGDMKVDVGIKLARTKRANADKLS